MGIMQRWLQVVANQQHTMTASGSTATFTTDMAAPTECRTDFGPGSGLTGLTVTRCGKNILPPTIYTIANSGTSVVSNASYRSMVARVEGGKTYTISRDAVSGNRFRIFATFNFPTAGAPAREISSTGDTLLQKTFTVPALYSYIVIFLADNDSTITSNIQLELGADATSFESYSGDTYTIDWSATAGTVYGGSVDITGGKVISEYSSGGTPLPTPQEYPFTPQVITALPGLNNVWTNIETVSVIYWTH